MPSDILLKDDIVAVQGPLVAPHITCNQLNVEGADVAEWMQRFEDTERRFKKIFVEDNTRIHAQIGGDLQVGGKCAVSSLELGGHSLEERLAAIEQKLAELTQRVEALTG